MDNGQKTQNAPGDNHQSHVNTGEIDGAGNLNPQADWSRSDVNAPRLIGTLFVLGAVLLVIVLGLTMCGTPAPTVNSGGAAGGPYDILQKKVDGAFGQARESAGAQEQQGAGAETGDTAASQPQEQGEQQQGQGQGQEQGQQQEQQQGERPEPPTPAEQQRQREEMLQQQREAVPSVLPENPPQPAPLGTGY